MDQGWKWFPLLVILLIFWRSALGFTGQISSNTYPRWGRPADNSLSPRAVQSSLSEVPLTGKFPVEEVGSGVLPDRSQKSRSRFANLRQYVKGGVSSSYESTSRTQTVPSGSVSASFALPQNEHHASSLTSLQLQGSSSSSVQDIASQLASGPSFQNQNASSSQGSSGLQSVGGSSQLVSLQGEGSNSGLSSPGISSQSTPDLYTKISSSSLITSSHATSDQSSPSLYMSSFPGGSGLLLEASGSASGQGGVSSYGDLSLQSQGTSSQYAPATSGQFLSSPVGVSSQSASDTNTLGLYASSSQSSSALQSAQVALPTYTQESLSSSPSIQAQGSTSQDSSRSELAGGSMLQSSTHELSGSYVGLSQSIPSQYSPGSLTSSKLSSMPLGLSSQPTSSQSLYRSSAPSRSGTPLATSSRYVAVQRGSSSRDLSSLKTRGTSAQNAPASPSKYVPMSSPQAVSSQSGGKQDLYRPVTQVGHSQAGASGQFMGASSFSSGSIPQSQGSLGQNAPASPSKYVSMSSPQGVSSQSTSLVSSQGSSSTLLGAASRFASQGLSSTYSGSVQSQGTISQLVSGYPTYSKLGSLPLVSSQSTSDQSSGRLTPTLQAGSQPQEVSHQFLSPQGGSSYYSGPLPQSQGSLGQNAFASPSKYVPMSSPQAVSSQSGGKQDLYRPVTQVGLSQAGASGQFMGASSFSSGSIPQSQGSLGQNAPASPSKYVSMSSPQGVSSQSTSLVSSQGSSSTLLGAASRFASQGLSSTYSGSVQSQGTISQLVSGYPTYSKLGSLPLVSSQSTSDQSSGRLTPTLQAGSQPQEVSHQFLSPQGGSSYYSGPLPQSQGSLGQNAFASPSKYVPMSSPQAVSSQSGGKQDLYRPVTQVGLSQAGASGQFMGASSFSIGSIPQSQGSLDQFASASPSKYVSMSSPQGVSSQSTSVVSSHGSSSTLLGAASRFASQGLSSSYSGSVQSQGTVSQLASGSPTYSKLSSLPLVSSQSTSDQSSGRLTPTLQVGSQPQEASRQFLSPQGGSSYYSGSLPQSQGSFSQYAPASPSKYVSMSSHQGLSSQSAPAPSSRRGLTSTFLGSSGSQSGSSLGLQSSSTYGGSYQPQGTRTQFASGSPSQYGSVSLASPQDVASQYSQASQSVYSLSQSQKPQRWQPSATSLTQGIQASGAAMSQGSYQSQSSQMLSRSSSLSSAVDSTYQSSPPVLSGGSDQLVSTQGRGDRYSGMFLQSPSTSNLYTRGSPAYAKLGSSPLGFTSQSTSDQSSSSLYGSSSQTRAGVQLASSQYASLQGGSSSVGSASQPQSIASQYAPAHLSVDLKAPVSSLYSQASPSGSSPSLSRQSQKLQPSASSWTQGVQTSDTAALQSIPSSVQSGQPSTSASWRTQGLLGGVQRPSRPLFLQAAPGSTISSQTLQRPADSSLKPEKGVSARKSSMGMFSSFSLPQTAPTLSGYPSYNQESSTSVTGEYAPFSGNYEQSVVSQRTSSASGSDDSSRYSLFGQNPVSDQPPRSSSGRYYSVKG